MTPDKSRRALGRGLAALIPTASPSAQSDGLRQLSIERIHPNPKQPRKQFDEDALDELAASIKSRGVLQPILVRRRGNDYEIVAGERRWRAAARAGHTELPALIQELTDVEAFQAALVENVQRQDLDPLDEAEAYSRLVREHGMTQEQVADAVGKSRVTIANSIRLLKLPESVLELLADRKLTAGHARALMTLKNEADIVTLAEDSVKRGATVRDVEQKARMMNRSTKRATKKPAQDPNQTNVEERLMRSLGTKARIRQRNGKGRIEVFFNSYEQLDELLEKIAP